MAGAPKDFSGRRGKGRETHLFLHNQVGTAVPERLSHGTRRLVRMWIKAAENRVYPLFLSMLRQRSVSAIGGPPSLARASLELSPRRRECYPAFYGGSRHLPA